MRWPHEYKERVIPKAWMSDFVRYYRPLGFFSRFPDFSDEEVGIAIEALFRTNYMTEKLAPLNEAGEVWVLCADDERFWVQDAEADWAIEDGVYREVLIALSNISRNTFNPTLKGERWFEAEEEIELSFEWGSKIHTIRAGYGDGWLEMSDFLKALNPIVASTGIQYGSLGGNAAVPSVVDQCYRIVGLRSDERAQLEREKGWRLQP